MECQQSCQSHRTWETRNDKQKMNDSVFKKTISFRNLGISKYWYNLQCCTPQAGHPSYPKGSFPQWWHLFNLSLAWFRSSTACSTLCSRQRSWSTAEPQPMLPLGQWWHVPLSHNPSSPLTAGALVDCMPERFKQVGPVQKFTCCRIWYSSWIQELGRSSSEIGVNGSI